MQNVAARALIGKHTQQLRAQKAPFAVERFLFWEEMAQFMQHLGVPGIFMDWHNHT